MVTTSCYNTFTSYTSPLLFLYSATLPLLRYHFFFALRLRACALQRCPSTLLFNAALQRCPSTLPFNAALRRCVQKLYQRPDLRTVPVWLFLAPLWCPSRFLDFSFCPRSPSLPSLSATSHTVPNLRHLSRCPKSPPPLTLSQISATSHVVLNLRHLSRCPKSPPPLTLSQISATSHAVPNLLLSSCSPPATIFFLPSVFVAANAFKVFFNVPDDKAVSRGKWLQKSLPATLHLCAWNRYFSLTQGTQCLRFKLCGKLCGKLSGKEKRCISHMRTSSTAASTATWTSSWRTQAQGDRLRRLHHLSQLLLPFCAFFEVFQLF